MDGVFLSSHAPKAIPALVEPLQQQILTSTEHVLKSADHVSIDAAAVAKIASQMTEGSILSRPSWSAKDRSRHFNDGTARTAQWLFILTTMNFCFWADKDSPAWEVRYNNETMTGYWALACALKEAMERGVPITDAHFLATIDRIKLQSILGGIGEIPLLDERVHALQEVGQVLLESYQGEFHFVIEDARQSAVRLANLVASHFSTFRDVATYHGRSVILMKRAQILCADLWGCFNGESFGTFHDIARLTAFADYRLPQVLRAMGILVYSDSLSEKIDHLVELDVDSTEEVEIRAATIQAVNALEAAAAVRDIQTNAVALDWWLWNLSQQATYRLKPHHRVRTFYY